MNLAQTIAFIILGAAVTVVGFIEHSGWEITGLGIAMLIVSIISIIYNIIDKHIEKKKTQK